MSALDCVRGCLKATSMLWMGALGLPVLSGVIVSDWSDASADAVRRFARARGFSQLLLRVDKPNERWSPRRGGYLLDLSQIATTVHELNGEGRIAILLEPASPYADQYSLAGVSVPDERKLVVEIVGPGFDASDVLRNDLEAHERWELGLGLAGRARRANRTHLTTAHKYAESVKRRLEKIGARIKDPAFPDALLNSVSNKGQLRRDATSFLKISHQTALLRHADGYVPIPRRHLLAFVGRVDSLLKGLGEYGIHLGPSSFAASIIPPRGLVFWDFFPARTQEASWLYPTP